jgi:hypothetical protein
MGVIQHNAILATAWSEECFLSARDWIGTLDEGERQMFFSMHSPVNSFWTVVLTPDGSKEGWPESEQGDALRDAFIAFLSTSDTGCWQWIEVGYGELGAQIVRTNCALEEEEGDE